MIYNFFVTFVQVAYPLFLGFFNFFLVIGLWIWFKRPVILFELQKWYVMKMEGIKVGYIDLSCGCIYYLYKLAPKASQPLVVFIHGICGESYNWASILKELTSHDISCMAIDLPSHGKSFNAEAAKNNVDDMALTVSEVLKVIVAKHGRVHLIGHSLGAVIAAKVAAEHSDLVEILSLSAPPGRGKTENHFIKMALNGDLSWLLPETFEGFKASLRKIMYNVPHIPNQILKGFYYKMMARFEIYDQLLRTAMKGDLKGIFSVADKIYQPTQVIWGALDEIVPVENLYELRGMMPSLLQEDCFEECGHSVPLERPADMARALRLFRKKCELKKFD